MMSVLHTNPIFLPICKRTMLTIPLDSVDIKQVGSSITMIVKIPRVCTNNLIIRILDFQRAS